MDEINIYNCLFPGCTNIISQGYFCNKCKKKNDENSKELKKTALKTKRVEKRKEREAAKGERISAIHLNRNIMCSVAAILTKSDYAEGDMIQVCFLPLNSELKPRQDVLPFDILLCPRRIRNINDLHEGKFECSPSLVSDAMLSGIPYYDSSELFGKWFADLALHAEKKIMVLTHDWHILHPFLKNWLPLYNDYFHNYYRDISVCSLYANDRADVRAERPPYPKSHLSYLASQLELSYEWNKAQALEKSIAIAEIYRLMLKQLF